MIVVRSDFYSIRIKHAQQRVVRTLTCIKHVLALGRNELISRLARWTANGGTATHSGPRNRLSASDRVAFVATFFVPACDFKFILAFITLIAFDYHRVHFSFFQGHFEMGCVLVFRIRASTIVVVVCSDFGSGRRLQDSKVCIKRTIAEIKSHEACSTGGKFKSGFARAMPDLTCKPSGRARYR